MHACARTRMHPSTHLMHTHTPTHLSHTHPPTPTHLSHTHTYPSTRLTRAHTHTPLYPSHACTHMPLCPSLSHTHPSTHLLHTWHTHTSAHLTIHQSIKHSLDLSAFFTFLDSHRGFTLCREAVGQNQLASPDTVSEYRVIREVMLISVLRVIFFLNVVEEKVTF